MCNQNQDNNTTYLSFALFVFFVFVVTRCRPIIIVTVLQLFFLFVCYYLTWVISLKLIKQQTKHLHIWEAIKLHRCRRHKNYAVDMVLCNNNNNNNKHRQTIFVVILFLIGFLSLLQINAQIRMKWLTIRVQRKQS